MTAVVTSGTTYVIVNVKSGTVIDLSAGDNKTVTGWPNNNGNNQKWTMNWTGSNWTFQNGATGTYLGIAGTPTDGLPIVAVSSPFGWDIWRDPVNPNTFRVYVPSTFENLDLYADGLATPGDPITLWTAWDGIHQTWIFNAV